MSDEQFETGGHRRAGQILFAIAFVVVSVALLAMLGDQTVWKAKVKFVAQPRFWPAVGVIGMAVFGGLHLWHLPRCKLGRYDAREGRIWLEAIEYAAWFLAYVWVVPIVGYLPTTMIFAPILTWRLGYRTAKMLSISVIFAIVVVVIFKGLLEVKIPGGAIYEYFPSAIRRIFIRYF